MVVIKIQILRNVDSEAQGKYDRQGCVGVMQLGPYTCRCCHIAGLCEMHRKWEATIR